MKQSSPLTEEQKQALASWLAAGATIAEVQKNLEHLFQLSMTYMEVKFLIDDLDLEIITPPSNKQPSKTDDKTLDESGAVLDEASDQMNGLGAVRVSVNPIARPGALASGDVQFSDGMKAGWQLDNFGRLALSPTQKGYQPSANDIQEFQVQLQKQLTSKGY
jgi:hypothetical protein